MKSIVVFDTSVGSLNKGDEIIMGSCKAALEPILDGNFYFTMPTKSPAFNWYQTCCLSTPDPTYDLKDLI